MSRFIEALNEYGPVFHIEKIQKLARGLLNRLDAQQAHVDFEFPFFLEKKAPVTGCRGPHGLHRALQRRLAEGGARFRPHGHRPGDDALPLLEGHLRRPARTTSAGR